MVTVEQSFSLEHPAAQGHFPGNPIIPGAVLLSETLRVIEESLDLILSRGQQVSAKFLQPARPGDSIRIEFSEFPAGTITFACAVGTTTVLTGKVTCEIVSTPA